MSDDFHIAIATHGSVVVRRVAAHLCGESHALSADSDDVTVLLFSIFVFSLSNSLSTERCWTWNLRADIFSLITVVSPSQMIWAELIYKRMNPVCTFSTEDGGCFCPAWSDNDGVALCRPLSCVLNLLHVVQQLWCFHQQLEVESCRRSTGCGGVDLLKRAFCWLLPPAAVTPPKTLVLNERRCQRFSHSQLKQQLQFRREQSLHEYFKPPTHVFQCWAEKLKLQTHFIVIFIYCIGFEAA